MIYLINLDSTSLYKIGKTSNIKNRIKQLQTGASFPLILIQTFKTGSEESHMERTIFRRFKSYKTSGEWFDFDQLEISKVIEDINQIQEGLLILANSPFIK